MSNTVTSFSLHKLFLLGYLGKFVFLAKEKVTSYIKDL
jgi:hypothetical protein